MYSTVLGKEMFCLPVHWQPFMLLNRVLAASALAARVNQHRVIVTGQIYTPFKFGTMQGLASIGPDCIQWAAPVGSTSFASTHSSSGLSKRSDASK